MIVLDQVTKEYHTKDGKFAALTDVTLHVKKGELFGVIGKSGAGKSTLIRCVNLLEKPTSGRVRVAGEELTSLSLQALRAARRKIGMIFQHFNLLSSRTVYDNVALPLELSGQSRGNIKKIILPLLELTGLSNKKNHYPGQLSGGQKQRVAIARALSCQPHVLLSDEATSSLDPETTNSILQLLKNIRDTFNVTILLITHEMSVIKACCDRVAILDHGKLIEENEAGIFFAHPKTDIAKKFIASSRSVHLPQTIAQYISANEQPHSHTVLRLQFMGKAATQPIVSQLVMQFHLQMNILQANVESIQKLLMGIMIVAIAGEKNNIQNGIQYLKSIDVQVEVMGYVANDVISFN